MVGEHYPRMPELPEDIRGDIFLDTVHQALAGTPRDLSRLYDCIGLIRFLKDTTERDPRELLNYWPQICEEVETAQPIFGVLPDRAEPIIGFPPLEDL